MKKQPEITAATRRNLIDAFWALYEKKNIGQIGIKEIAGLAGYHRATFYMYFTDIYDLLHQEEDDLIEQIRSYDSSSLRAGGIDGAFQQIADFYMKNGKRLSLLIRVGGDSGFMRKFKNTLYPAFRSLWGLSDTAESSVIYEFGINGLLMSFYDWYEKKGQLPVEDFIRIARSLIEYGVMQTIEKHKQNDAHPSV